MRALAGDHQVTLLSFTDGSEPAEGRRELEKYCARLETVQLPRPRSWIQAWAGVFSWVPSQVAFYRSGEMRACVARALAAERFDAIFVQLFRMAPYLEGVAHPAKVLFLADSMAMNLSRAARFQPRWRRLGMIWERWRVARFEAHATRSFAESWVVSAVDRDDLTQRGCANVVAVPHGVDERLFELVRRPGPTPCIVFLGNLAVPHNVDAASYAAREILPEIRRHVPAARLRLVGAHPTPAVRGLSSLAGVEVTGSVPDLAPVWSGAHVLLAPLRFSTGIQNKVLEAMAAGVPVVTTPQVAEAMGARDGELLRVGADTDALARAVEEILAHPEAAAPMVERARRHARAHFSWAALARELERVARAASRAS